MTSKVQRQGTPPQPSRQLARRQARKARAQSRTQREPRGIALIYSSLYLDRGETVETAIEQVDQLIRSQSRPLAQLALAFDIVSTPMQIRSGAAHAAARHVLRYADTRYPGLYLRTVGITDHADRRPVRDLIDESKIDNVHLFVVEDY